MSQIFITGDLHGEIEISKLNMKNFPEQANLTKNDYLIICGDFGLVWQGGKQEEYWRKWLNSRNFTTLFVDGNHENFDTLDSMTVHNWNGGKVHFVEEHIIHLMRGQVFTISDLTFFTMGGASSIDREFRREGISWWPQEIPTADDFAEGLDNLEKYNWEVDYILTHTTSRTIMDQMGYVKEQNTLNTYLNILDNMITYKKWFFGHFHSDEIIDEKHHLLYRKIIKIN